MGKVNGMKEKLHYPIYDAFYVLKATADGRQPTFVEAMGGDRQRIQFFTNIQGKTRLETNLQAAGVLPSMNSLEVRALRIIVAADRGNLKRQDPNDVETPITTAEFIESLIFNSVTTLLVGEKLQIEAPTFWFPSGTGVSTTTDDMADFGRPDPMATFRFAEPVFIDPQQNFRVEMQFPRNVPPEVEKCKGPIWVWAALDGYLTRDVQ